jgi:phage terminase large subunit
MLQPARYKGLHGGRGSGKSHFFAEMLVEEATIRPGLRAVCVREVQKSLKQSVKLLVEDKIRSMGVSHLFEVFEAEIRTPGGGVIIFQGMQNHTADSIKSLEGFDIAWCEEAQSLSQRSLDLLRPTIRKPGSELWFSWNPNSPQDPIDVLLRGDHPPSGAVVIEINWNDNPWLPDELRDEQEDDKRRDPDKWAHVWGGQYSLNSEARVFRNWRIEDFEAPRNAVHRFGADWGFAMDPTALVRCHIEGRTLFVDYEAVEVGCEIDETPYLFSGDAKPENWPNGSAYINGPSPISPQRKRRDGIPRANLDLIRADSARPETVSYMRRHGYKITPAIKGPGSVEDGIQFLKAFDIVVHPRCLNVIGELTLFAYKIDPHTGEVLSELDDKNNHTIDALRYALEELRRSGYKPREEAKKPARDGYWPAERGNDDWMTV